MKNQIPICALVIGHSKTDGGAVSASSQINEYRFNDALAVDIAAQVAPELCRVIVMHREHGYSKLPGEVNAVNPNFVIELHANAANGEATGTEVLYWHRSVHGRMYAGILQARLVAALGLKDRQVKPTGPDGRGALLLKNTNAPCLIAEPFFIDNDDDLHVALTKRAALVRAYARSIEEIARMKI